MKAKGRVAYDSAFVTSLPVVADWNTLMQALIIQFRPRSRRRSQVKKRRRERQLESLALSQESLEHKRH